MVQTSTEHGRTPFSDALGEAIAGRGVTLGWLHERLRSLGTPVSLATLSYWRSGRSQPEHATSLDALTSLDELLYLPLGHLRSQLQPSRRARPRPRRLSYGELMSSTPGTRRLLDTLGYPPDSPIDLEETSVHLTLNVDHNGWGRSVVSRSVWRALRDGVRGQPDMIELENPQGEPPRFRAVSGCTLGRSGYDRREDLFGYEVLLDRPLGLGETAVAEYELEFPGEPHIDTIFAMELTWKVSEMMLWVRFDPSMVPTSCEAFVEGPDGIATERPLSLNGTNAAHHVVHNFGPAVVGIRWTW